MRHKKSSLPPAAPQHQQQQQPTTKTTRGDAAAAAAHISSDSSQSPVVMNPRANFLRKGLPKASSTPSRAAAASGSALQSNITSSSKSSNVTRYNPLQRNPNLMKELKLVEYTPKPKLLAKNRPINIQLVKARKKALLIAKAPFYRMLKKELQNVTGDKFFKFATNVPQNSNIVNRITISAVELLQEVTEMLLVFLVEDVNRVALHCGRVTVMAKDFHIVSEIRKSFGLNLNTKF
ncbi:MAG: hypothetical protein MHMPM18_002610 [Marteilia pararefringens]